MNETKAKVSVFEKVYPSIFENARPFYVVAQLTKDHFNIEIKMDDKNNDWLSSHAYCFINISPKDEVLKELNDLQFFKTPSTHDIFKIKEESLYRYKELVETNVRITEKVHLDTGNGGKVRTEEKIKERYKIAKEYLQRRIDNGEVDKIIKNKIAWWTENIEKYILQYNRDTYRRIIMSTFTRSGLNECIEFNEKSGNIELDDIIPFKKDVAAVDAEIEIYRKKIEALEQKKSQLYTDQAFNFFKEELEKIEPGIRKELEKLRDEYKLFHKERRNILH